MPGTPQTRRQINEFIDRWKAAEGNEDREARSFLIGFLQDVLGIQNPTKVLDFERRVKGRKVEAFYEDMGILIEAFISTLLGRHSFGTAKPPTKHMCM